MLSEKQLKLAKNEPKEFLQQYAFLRIRAESKLKRANFWQDCNLGREYCKACFTEAKNLIMLESDISKLIAQADISEQFKTFLYLRYIECQTINEIAETLGYTKRWCQCIQVKALDAFAQAI